MIENKIIPENRVQGREAHHQNIAIAKVISDCVRTTLGPKGMDKMIIDDMGDVTITNDGVTILSEMNITHPAGKLIVELSKSQENKVGDGTTTAVVLAGELLKNAELLLNEGIHPTNIATGYKRASDEAIKILNEIAVPINMSNKDLMLNVASTAMTGKGSEYSKIALSDMVVQAVLQVIDENNEFDKDCLRIKTLNANSTNESQIIKGVVIDKVRTHNEMPNKVENAKVLLIDFGIEVREPETEHKYQIDNPAQLQAFSDEEDRIISEMVSKIVKAKPDVVFCSGNIADIANYHFAKQGILCLKRIKSTDMIRLSKATGAKIISDVKDITSDVLSQPCLVEERKFGDERLTFVTGCLNPKAVTILLFGSTDHVVDELRRALDDAIGDVRSLLKDMKIVSGAGSAESVIAKRIKDGVYNVTGRERLAMDAFARSMQIIPKSLAESAGMDPIDTIPELEAFKYDETTKRWMYLGVDVMNKKVASSDELAVYEPIGVKEHAIKAATEAAIMILRIDDILAGTPRIDKK